MPQARIRTISCPDPILLRFHRREALASRRLGGFPPCLAGQCPTPISPASIAIDRRFCDGGSGQVAYGVTAHGGAYALLKSRITRPSFGGSACKNLPAP